MYFNFEEIMQAKQVDLLTYLQTCAPGELVKEDCRIKQEYNPKLSVCEESFTVCNRKTT